MSGTYVTDITHYLDDTGAIVADAPDEARQMASFLTLLIDEASQAIGVRGHETSVRCRTGSCQGSILVSLPSPSESVNWCCLECGQNGIINNWQGTKWNRGGPPLMEPRPVDFTKLQGQYLAFIFYYTKVNGCPPAEADMQRYFEVTPPTVHQMVKTLEAKGFIERTPRKARSIRLLLSREELPELE